MLIVFTLAMVLAVVFVLIGLVYITMGITYRKIWKGIIGMAFLALAVVSYYFFYSMYVLDQMGLSIF
ncbi:hypothetical protein [Flavobacterium sp.]|uniref:hypothetical protein n=1 Tax=Flavobacterium sp. TaxID=239 RepID=UPI0039E46639